MFEEKIVEFYRSACDSVAENDAVVTHLKTIERRTVYTYIRADTAKYQHLLPKAAEEHVEVGLEERTITSFTHQIVIFCRFKFVDNFNTRGSL